MLGALGDEDIPIRLIVGHEKAPDPPDVAAKSLGSLIKAVKAFRLQYQSTSEADVEHFLSGNLEYIELGGGLGNSMADLLLSYEGWKFGHYVAQGKFSTLGEMANWVRRELGKESIDSGS
jgi:hypothetical protein